jgi:phosphatidylinositol alpha-1,6-mannosyltransferase
MHIVVLTLDFAPAVGGVQIYLYEILRRVARSHQVTVVTPVTGDLPPTAAMSVLTLTSRKASGFRRALATLRPDRLVVGHAHPQLLLAAFSYPRLGYATITYGNDYLAAQKCWHRPLFNWLLRRSQPLITITQANADRLRALAMPTPHIVRPGTDPSRFSPPPAPPPGPPVLLTVGRLVRRKGIDTVLESLSGLLPENPGLRYQVVGDGPDRERLQHRSQELGLQKVVTFLGRVSDPQLLSLYRQAHVFVMVAREERQSASMEGFGIVYLEASACGLPVVAGRSGGAGEAMRDGVTGFLVPSDDPQQLSEALGKLLADPELRRRQGLAGRQWVEDEMNWDRSAEKMCAALGLTAGGREAWVERSR